MERRIILTLGLLYFTGQVHNYGIHQLAGIIKENQHINTEPNLELTKDDKVQPIPEETISLNSLVKEGKNIKKRKVLVPQSDLNKRYNDKVNKYEPTDYGKTQEQTSLGSLMKGDKNIEKREAFMPQNSYNTQFYDPEIVNKEIDGITDYVNQQTQYVKGITDMAKKIKNDTRGFTKKTLVNPDRTVYTKSSDDVYTFGDENTRGVSYVNTNINVVQPKRNKSVIRTSAPGYNMTIIRDVPADELSNVGGNINGYGYKNGFVDIVRNEGTAGSDDNSDGFDQRSGDNNRYGSGNGERVSGSENRNKNRNGVVRNSGETDTNTNIDNYKPYRTSTAPSRDYIDRYTTPSYYENHGRYGDSTVRNLGTNGYNRDHSSNNGYGLTNGNVPESNGYESPNNGYRSPNNGYGSPNNGDGSPSYGYGSPSNGYGSPSNGYGSPNNGYSNGYGSGIYNSRNNGRGITSSSHGSRNNGYGSSNNGYESSGQGYRSGSDSYNSRNNGQASSSNRYGTEYNRYGSTNTRYDSDRGSANNGYSSGYDSPNNGRRSFGNSYDSQNYGDDSSRHELSSKGYRPRSNTYSYNEREIPANGFGSQNNRESHVDYQKPNNTQPLNSGYNYNEQNYNPYTTPKDLFKDLFPLSKHTEFFAEPTPSVLLGEFHYRKKRSSYKYGKSNKPIIGIINTTPKTSQAEVIFGNNCPKLFARLSIGGKKFCAKNDSVKITNDDDDDDYM